MIDTILQDLRHAARSLRRTPGFAVAAIATLALGIGANTAIFSLIDTAILETLPVASADRLFQAREVVPALPTQTRPQRFSYPRLLDLQRALPAAASLAGTTPATTFAVRERSDGELGVARGQLVTGRYFDTVGVAPAAGRLLGAADNASIDAHPVTVLTERYARRVFGTPAAAVGRDLIVGGRRLTVVGVTAGAFAGVWADDPTDLWLPASMQHALHYQAHVSEDDADLEQPWGPQDAVGWLTVLVRVPGDPQDVQQALALANRQGLERAAQRTSDAPARRQLLTRQLVLEPFARGFSAFRDQYSTALVTLMALVALVLVIACANVANRLLARSAARARETEIRSALGASRARLLREALLESLLLAGLGGLGGVAIAGGLARAIAGAMATASADVLVDATMPSPRVLAFTAALSLLVALIFGLLPAWRVTDRRRRLNGQVRGATRGGLAGMRPLVAAQLGLSFVVVLTAVLLGRTLLNLSRFDPGFERRQLVTVEFDATRNGYTPAQMPALATRLVDAVERVPGVTSATAAAFGLLSEGQWTSDFRFESYQPGPGENIDVQANVVGAGYFGTVGIPMVTGRDFDQHDSATSGPVAIVNEALARRYFDGRSPLDMHVDGDVRIVGVVRDARVKGVRTSVAPTIYFPVSQAPVGIYSLEAHVSGDPHTAATTIRETLRRVEPGLQIDTATPIAERLATSVQRDAQMAYLTSAFGILAMLLACIGLYGVLSYVVTQRTQEIGVRVAIGATPGRVLSLVMGDSLRVVLAGLALGAVTAYAAGRFMTTLLFGVQSSDPGSYVAVTLALLAVSMGASYLPARRAAAVDPVVALAAE